MIELAAAKGWDWQVELVFNPDKVLAEASTIIVTSDSAILDRCQRWCNLTRQVVTQSIPRAWVVDLSRAAACRLGSSGARGAEEPRSD